MTTPIKTGFESAIALTPCKGVFYADIGKNSMVMDKKLLDILCCPASRQALLPLPSNTLAALNAGIAGGLICQQDGQIVDAAPLREALITADGKWIYRIDDGIPVLLVDEAIAASQSGLA
jgi:uncharacterized protein YbaR (Trm112 family)